MPWQLQALAALVVALWATSTIFKIIGDEYETASKLRVAANRLLRTRELRRQYDREEAIDDQGAVEPPPPEQ